MKNKALQYGLIYGVISALILLIIYFVDSSTLFSTTYSAIGIVVAAIFMWLAATKERQMRGGFINFGEAFVPSFLTYLIGSFIGGISFYILINFIDSSLIEVFKEYSLSAAEAGLRFSGLPEEQVLEQMDKMQEEQAADGNPFGIGTSLMGFAISSIVFGLPLSAIIAAIVKKKQPE